MKARIVAAAASLLGLAGAGTAFNRFRRELKAAKARVESGSTVEETAKGPIEFACAGSGQPVLSIHGAGGGYDQGLLIAQNTFRDGYQLIAPSRFGYLRTAVPDDTTPAAQAEAHVALLDHLGIARAIVLGASAGAPSALELALRHPERVAALILLVPRCIHPDQKVGVQPGRMNRAIVEVMERGADFAYWTLLKTARSHIVRFLGVPPELEVKAAKPDRAALDALMRSLLPLSARIQGLRVDGEAEITDLPLEKIEVPTLVLSARDDGYGTAPAAEFAASRIRGGKLHIFESGGHLLVGRTGEVKVIVEAFLRQHPEMKQAA